MPPDPVAWPQRAIRGFHRDAENDWVADLECGHARHVRHNPPWQSRPWVSTAAGRAAQRGQPLGCKHCFLESLEHQPMIYRKSCDKSVDATVSALNEAVSAHKFGVLHTYDIKQTLNNKGVEFDTEARVLEICNPMRAKQVLSTNMDLLSALPCRISVHSEGSQSIISMIRPAALLQQLSDDPELQQIAAEVEQISLDIIEQASNA